MVVRVTIHEHEPAARVESIEQLDAVFSQAESEARERGMLNVIFLESENGNTLYLAVGGDETAAGFDYSHLEPPCFASKGPSNENDPVLTCFGSFSTHTEFPRK